MTPVAGRVEAVLLDLDGTLVDSLPGIHAAAADAMADLALPVPDVATVRGFVGHGVPALAARLAAWGGAPALAQAVERLFRARYDADPVSGTAALPGAAALLAGLHAAGVPAAVVTNKPEAPARAILSALSLGPLAAVVGGDTLPECKPDPAPLLHAARAVGADPARCVMVGDAAPDAEAARAAGMPLLLVAGGYGALPDGAPTLPDLEAVGRALGLGAAAPLQRGGRVAS